MRRDLPRRPAVACLSALCFLVIYTGSLLIPIPSARADDPAPKKKDSNARIKSKYAELTTSVEPSEAKPGDIVTFKVTARLDPGFHIYKYIKTPANGADGPVYTTFDLFDTGALEPEGDWTASNEPTKHKDDAWPNLPFIEYYEEDVTWSHKLKVPPGAAPGKKTLRVQARYMICDDKGCSPPGQWTLPAATLTVLPADGAAKPSAVAPKPAVATPEKTASHDTGPRRPRPWSRRKPQRPRASPRHRRRPRCRRPRRRRDRGPSVEHRDGRRIPIEARQ